MANEFKHKDPGGELTQAEFIAACGDGHIFACQATGDILYASSATVLKNLGKGAANTVLHMGGSCIPAWTASPSVTDLTIGGGCITLTGAATDIDLIDNNASALSFDASGKAGIIDIVTTDCSEGVTMSGTLGVTGVMTATGGIELSHATANTLTASSGVLSIEGNRVFHACGTDIPVADGGTGASTFTANGILVGNGTSAVAVTATMATKGHVMIGDGSGVPTMLAVGTNCYVLTACSGEATGVKWAAAGGGCVVCDTSPVLGGSLDASCETILNIGAAGNDILATGVRVINGAACAPSLSFTCDTDTGIYRAGANTIGWTTAGAVGMTLGAEHLTISDGNLVIGTAGHGIDFSAQASPASGMTAELLDRYEIGTFSPTYTFGGGNTGLTYTTQIGRYTRIGDTVYIAVSLTVNSNGSSTGSAVLAGLPFASSASQPGGFAIGEEQSITFANQMLLKLTSGAATIGLNEVTEAGSFSALTQANVPDSSELKFTGFYKT
jgi:hypothetical protein